MMAEPDLIGLLARLEGEVERLRHRLDAVVAQLSDAPDAQAAVDAWAEEVAYADQVRQLYLWQLYRRPGESDQQMRIRFFHSLPEATWDPVAAVRRASLALLGLVDRIARARGVDYWLEGQGLADAVQYGGFSPVAAQLRIGVLGRPGLEAIRAGLVPGVVLSGSLRSTKRVTAFALTGARVPLARLEIRRYDTVAAWVARHPGCTTEALLPTTALDCYGGTFQVPADPGAALAALGLDVTALPDQVESREFSSWGETVVRDLNQFAEALSAPSPQA
jgi:hypothetical protein